MTARLVAAVVELVGFGALVAGVLLLAGVGWALVAAGVLAVASAALIDPELRRRGGQ